MEDLICLLATVRTLNMGRTWLLQNVFEYPPLHGLVAENSRKGVIGSGIVVKTWKAHPAYPTCEFPRV